MRTFLVKFFLVASDIFFCKFEEFLHILLRFYRKGKLVTNKLSNQVILNIQHMVHLWVSLFLSYSKKGLLS